MVFVADAGASGGSILGQKKAAGPSIFEGMR